MEETEPISVGTFNLRGLSEEKDEKNKANAWGHRAPLTIETINKIGADCLGFQEFGKNNIDFYKNNLNMELYLGPEMDNDRYNPIAFRPDRLSIKDTGVIWLSPTDEPVPAWGADETRSAVYAVFEDRNGGNVLFLNTHLDNKNELARVQGTKKILQRLSQFPDELPKIVVGDFNSSYYRPHERTNYTSTAHELFIANGFQDAFVVANPDRIDTPPTTFHDFEGTDYQPDQYGTWHTDWILYKGAKLHAYDINQDKQDKEPHFPSDHFAINAQLKVHTPSQRRPTPPKKVLTHA